MHKLAWCVLFCSIGFVIYLLTNYQVVWVQPENFVKRDMVLQTSYPNLGAVFLETFNWSVLEAGAPRLTRLMSSFFDVIDSHFRNWFNSNVFPHPSISVTWIFSLVLSPLFLFRGLLLAGCKKEIALYSLAIYFSLPGVLSLLVMGFRPGKSVALFFIIYIMYLMLKVSTEYDTIRKKRSILSLAELYIVTVFAVALFTDEIAVFALAPIALLHHYRNPKSLALPILAILVSIAYFLFTQTMLPAIHSWAGFPVTCPDVHCQNGQYNLQAKFFAAFFSGSTSVYAHVSHVIWLNLLSAIRDLSAIGLLWDSRWSPPWFMGCASLLGLSGLAAAYFIATRNPDNISSWRGISGIRIFILFGSAVLLHGLLMSVTDHPVWGVYWYSCEVLYSNILCRASPIKL